MIFKFEKDACPGSPAAPSFYLFAATFAASPTVAVPTAAANCAAGTANAPEALITFATCASLLVNVENVRACQLLYEFWGDGARWRAIWLT